MQTFSSSTAYWFRVTVLFVLQFGMVVVVQAQDVKVFVLKASDWNVPRTSEAILAMPALHETMILYNKDPKSQIRIHYPGGDEGTLWVTELRSWLVSLGLASRHIELLPGSRDPGQIELEVSTPGVFGSRAN